MKAKSIQGNSTSAIETAIAQSMAGFFCYGEFGKSKNGKHEFHNNTCCVVALKEK